MSPQVTEPRLRWDRVFLVVAIALSGAFLGVVSVVAFHFIAKWW